MSNVWQQWKDRARALKREVVALWLAYRDPRTPWGAKLLAALVVAYAFSPIDLIPDFIPVVGYLDDLILLPLGVALALKMIPAEVMADARARADKALAEGKPVNYWAAAVIVAIWIALAAGAIVLIWRLLGG